MIKQSKIDDVNNLVSKLQEKNNIILTNFSGVKVAELNSLRKQLRDKGADYKVVKNTLFKRAMKEVGAVDISEHLSGPVAVTFTSKDLSDIAKVLRDFKKDQENFSYSIGVMDNIVYDEKQIKKIADLPSKEALISQVMSLINGPTTNIAMGINQVIASLARGIKAVAEKNAG